MSSIEVIIPARNMAGHINRVVDPLLRQVEPGDVVTIVDDASTDDTGDAARSAGAHVVPIAVSRGPYLARQVAAARSQADVLLFVDMRCRPLPGLLAAHRDMHSRAGVALSCTDVRTLSGPTLAARVAAAQQPFSVSKTTGVAGRPPFYPTANLGVRRSAFDSVGGFRAMRSGADADLCWRIQDAGLGAMAVDTRVLMEWQPRESLRDLAEQWHRYGESTAYLERVYEHYTTATTAAQTSVGARMRARRRTGAAPATAPAVAAARLAISAVYLYGYLRAKHLRPDHTPPRPYDLAVAEGLV